MAEFISLADARQAMKGNFVGTIIAISDLKSGTKDNRDWSKKNITVEDRSAKMTLTAWNGEIKLFELNATYEFTGMWFKSYKDDVYLAMGKGGKVKKIEATTPPTEPTAHQEKTTPEPTPEPPTQNVMLTTNQKITHDEVWAFALVEATKVYPLGTAGADPNLTSRLILAQVFYKKNMDYLIHRGGK